MDGRPNLRFKKKMDSCRWGLNLLLFCRSCVRCSRRYLSLVLTCALKRKHKHKKNGHVRFSLAYAYAYVVAFSDQ